MCRKRERPKRGSWRESRNLVYWLSCEWLLENRPNGGAVVLGRALLISLMFYTVAMPLHSWASSGWSFDFDLRQLGRDVSETLPWFGAIFAGTYAALYARFSAQWSYLANVYNQLMATQAQIGRPNDNEKIQLWKAGFAEDAEDLHLATKRIFASIVAAVLDDPKVAEKFDQHTKGGLERRERLRAAVGRIVD